MNLFKSRISGGTLIFAMFLAIFVGMIIPTKVQAANNPQGTEYYIWKDKVTTDAEGNTLANTGLFTVTESGGVTTITLEQDITEIGRAHV